MTVFQRVADMNTAFGNAKGNPSKIDWDRIRAQSKNIGDEFTELMTALGADDKSIKALKTAVAGIKFDADKEVNLNEVRDGLCDVVVFSHGAHHLMGYCADADMNAVINGVMTRFVKDAADLQATLRAHAANGVVDVYAEGQFPTMVLKSNSDQPDAPKGKFLKSASYKPTKFGPPPGN